MQETSTYNGWSNRETWLASLWLNNDEGSYDRMMKSRLIDWDLYLASKNAKELCMTYFRVVIGRD